MNTTRSTLKNFLEDYTKKMHSSDEGHEAISEKLISEYMETSKIIDLLYDLDILDRVNWALTNHKMQGQPIQMVVGACLMSWLDSVIEHNT